MAEQQKPKWQEDAERRQANEEEAERLRETTRLLQQEEVQQELLGKRPITTGIVPCGCAHETETGQEIFQKGVPAWTATAALLGDPTAMLGIVMSQDQDADNQQETNRMMMARQQNGR
ncbi:MAG: hypothetical protein FWF01_04035 [Alphaproteobacteria bacterium]|nr:hypothetical protein [Alphaproteobacteria bacterium]